MKLIKNQPIGEDKFEGQAQENIANAIVTILEENSCQMIGIDGGWGTGKSNLVGIVEDKLSKSKKGKFHIFTYDAWGHQGDLHRKAILQELVEFLCKKKGVLKWETWGEKLKKLLGTAVETTKKTTPKLSLGIILSFLIVLSIPILNSIANDENTATNSKIWIQLIPVAALIAMYLGYVIKELLKRKRKELKFWSIFSVAASEMVYVYKGKELEATATEYKHESNPSVFDFRSFMEQISTELGKKRLIIVLDNFDRLPNIQVKELWASIHTLFAEKNNCSNITVIVPFDRVHIKSAFRDEDIHQSKKSINCFGNDYINKTFDIIFRVSMPVLSDWEQFFRDKWEYAFGEIKAENESEYNAVVQIYDLLTPKITPREIVAFVNECATIRITHREEIPFRYIALFIKGKDQILNDPIKEITTPSYLETVAFLYQNDDDLPQFISALVYQVHSSKAIDVAYKKALKDALEGKQIKTVKQISESKSFYSILKNTINEVSNIENLILALEDIPSEAFLSTSNFQTIWTCIFKKAENYPDDRIEMQDYQRVLLDKTMRNEKERYTRKLLKGFDSSSNFNPVPYVNNIKTIDSILKPLNIDVYSYLTAIQIEIDPFIQLLNSIDEKPAIYKITCDANEIDSYLANRMIEELKQISFVPQIIDNFSLSIYKARLQQELPSAFTDPQQLEIIISKLKEVQKVIPLSEISDKFLIKSYNLISEESLIFPDIIAMLIAKQSNAPDFIEVLASSDTILIEKVADCLGYYFHFSGLLLGLDVFGKYPLYKGIAQKIVTNPSNLQVKDVESMLANFEIICINGEIEPEVLINKLNDNTELDFNLENIPTALPIYLIKNTLQNANNLTVHCRSSVLGYLSEMDEGKWINAFLNIDSYEVNAAILLNFDWNAFSINAVKTVLVKMAIGEINCQNMDKWNELIQSIVTCKNMSSTFNSITDALCGRPLEITVDQFLFFMPWLYQYSPELIRRNDALRKLFPSTLFSNNDCLLIINSNIDKMNKIIENAGTEANDFRESVVEHAKRGNILTQQLAGALKIEIPVNNEKNDDDNSDENK